MKVTGVTYRRTGLMTALMLPYEARQTRSLKTASARIEGWSSSFGLSNSAAAILRGQSVQSTRYRLRIPDVYRSIVIPISIGI